MYGDPTAKEGRIGIYGTTGDGHDMSPRLLTSFADAARAAAESVDTIVDPDPADRADSLTRELRAALVHPAVGADAQSC
ncbi:hypothetical protein OG898_28790 [Streptomyces sp. NBC_00193]|uniref:hypothetical protein n=1 Tax=unclassified Streptomyces TaxID=2593676 RepID=UPI0022560089|nr:MULTISPECIES: hypothetical protein [unclassified Streptomyces]MCX5129903.1 hypothetical protein [Streptomyces sp. NBC_00347]MCX5300417.1 hypothetical protein [Streptomyces sp. NBC_00193]